MPRFEPFPGIRYSPDLDPAAVTAPPYDVIDERDRAALLERSDRNVVRVDLPTEADGPSRYEAAAAAFAAWCEDGTLVEDPSPTFTAYEMRFTDDEGRPARTLGVIGALELSRPDEGEILPHEHTTPKAKTDRLDLIRATGVNLSPVWMLTLAKGLTDLLASDAPADAEWSDADGVVHAAWRITDADRIAAISALVGSAPVVVADGHHRYETSLAHRDERRAQAGDDALASDAFMTFVVELTDDELTVRPIHRLIDGIDAPGVIDALVASGGVVGTTIEPAAVASGAVLGAMTDAGAVAVVGADGSATLVALDAASFPDVDDLDSARLAVALEDTAAEVRYQHGVDHVVRAVSAGEAAAGVLLRPATVAQIEANAHAGRRMPPKTTFFHPKPRTGVVFRAC